jgi:hypothetical protein
VSSEEASTGENDLSIPTNLDDLLDSDLDGLLDAPEKPQKISASDRLERAFLEIVEFRRVKGVLPDQQTRQIAERKLGARLAGILASDEKVLALKPLDDDFGLLETPEPPQSLDDLLDSDDLDLLKDETGLLDVSDLPVRKPPGEVDSVAKRNKCEDFDKFEDLFKAKHAELAEGAVQLAPFRGLRTVAAGRFYVLNGIMLFVAEVGESREMVLGGKPEQKQRLRVIFENGTESAMYRQSLSIRLFEQQGQAIVGSGFSDEDVLDGNERASGYVYVLRSLSDDPQIAGVKDLHKIGFSRGPVERRIIGAATSPTYLMAPVEVVASYQTFDLNVSKFERLLHQVFAGVRLDITQFDRKGRSFDPAEWFVVPLPVVDQVVDLIISGEITNYTYDRESQRIRGRTP